MTTVEPDDPTGPLLALGGKRRRRRDWFDYVGTLLLPAVIFVGGTLYTIHRDAVERERLEWDRDAEFVKDLTSTSPNERQYGLLIVQGLIRENKFPKDLLPVMTALSQGRATDPVTQVAAKFVAASSPRATATARPLPAPGSTALPAQARGAVAAAFPLQVFMQVARKEQLGAAEELASDLSKAGFNVHPTEIATDPPPCSTVRYFSPKASVSAQQINHLFDLLGFQPTTQQLTPPTPASPQQIEVWFGSADGNSILEDESGHPITDERGGAILTEDGRSLKTAEGKPFIVGCSKLG